MAAVSLEDLLREGKAAARAGAVEEARRMFERATEVAPESVEAWLGLAGVVEEIERKRACFQRALALDPDNAEARAGLAWLDRQARAKGDHQGAAEGTAEPETLYCVNHPDRETLLRCNKCGRPVCMDCVQLTEVGYRCRDCINQVRSSFYTASAMDHPIAALVGCAVAAVATPIVGWVAGLFGFWGFWIALLIGPAAGGALAEIIHRAVKRRRGRYLWLVACLGTALGVLIGSIGLWILIGVFPLVSLPVWLFLALALSTVYARLH